MNNLDTFYLIMTKYDMCRNATLWRFGMSQIGVWEWVFSQKTFVGEAIVLIRNDHQIFVEPC